MKHVPFAVLVTGLALTPLFVAAKTYNAVRVLTFACAPVAVPRVVDVAVGNPTVALLALRREPTCVQVGSFLQRIEPSMSMPPSVEVINLLEVENVAGKVSSQQFLRLRMPIRIEPDGQRL